jgi:hypothetical protein
MRYDVRLERASEVPERWSVWINDLNGAGVFFAYYDTRDLAVHNVALAIADDLRWNRPREAE